MKSFRFETAKNEAKIDFIVTVCEGEMRAAIRAPITFGHEQKARSANRWDVIRTYLSHVLKDQFKARAH